MENEIKKRIKDSKRIVVKVGTSTLTYPNGNLNLNLMNRLAWILADLKNQDKEVILVTSGAIGVGSKSLNFKKRPTMEREKQTQTTLLKLFLSLE